MQFKSFRKDCGYAFDGGKMVTSSKTIENNITNYKYIYLVVYFTEKTKQKKRTRK